MTTSQPAADSGPGPDDAGARPSPSISRRALRDGVYDALLEKILDGSAPAGSSLTIDALARELAVSPTPVREALVQMEHTGLVTREALKGYRVAPPMSREHLEQLFDMRLILEPAAAARAMARIEELLPELRAAHARHEAAAERVRRRLDEGRPTTGEGFAELREYFTADWSFHLAIVHASGNVFLQQSLDSLQTHVQRMRQTADHGRLDMDEAVAEHADVLAAFETREPTTVDDALRRHLHAVAGRVSSDG